MTYYVDMNANLLPGMSDPEGRTLPESEATARLAEFRESNMKMIVAAPYFRPETDTPAAFLAARDEKIAAVSEAAQPIRLVGGAVERARELDYEDGVLGRQADDRKNAHLEVHVVVHAARA